MSNTARWTRSMSVAIAQGCLAIGFIVGPLVSQSNWVMLVASPLAVFLCLRSAFKARREYLRLDEVVLDQPVVDQSEQPTMAIVSAPATDLPAKHVGGYTSNAGYPSGTVK